jgi:hypothetical protein
MHTDSRLAKLLKTGGWLKAEGSWSMAYGFMVHGKKIIGLIYLSLP